MEVVKQLREPLFDRKANLKVRYEGDIAFEDVSFVYSERRT